MKTKLVPNSDRSASPILYFLAFDGALPADAALATAIKKADATGDLSTEFRRVSLFYPEHASCKRLAFLGAGNRKGLTADRLRRLAAVAQQHAESLQVASLRLIVDEGDCGALDAEAAGRAVAEGLELGAYRYQPPSQNKPKARYAQAAEVLYRGKQARQFETGMRIGRIGAEATCFARDLENRPGNLATPTDLARAAKKLQGNSISVKVLDEAAMQRLKMGALLGVARGSKQPAKLILLDYNPRGAKETICVVGKGLTFDSGGISIKPSAKMDEMRYDMCGGGAVLGLFAAISKGGLTGARKKIRVVGVVPSTENMPDADAQKPGDVVTACNGTTIEILNTDAEGRLILADALAYARRTYKPSLMVDLATLTGAVVVALGHEVAGIMGNDESLIEALIGAGKAVDDPLWQLPLWDVHKDQCKSKFADIANLNSPADGNGSTAGGAFLSYFVGDTPWAHIDIAGSAWGQRPRDYYTHGATGTGVRMLLHWLRSRG